jgi:MFS family permease
MAERIEADSVSVESGKSEIRHKWGALRSLRHRDFALFWFGLLVSSIGSWMQNLAQGWLVYELTHRKDYLGFVGAAGTLPILFLTLPSGVIADRFNKRRITIITQTLLAAQALALAILAYYEIVRPWHVLLLASFAGLANALDVPARQAMTIELVGRDDLLNAVALNSSAFNSARIVGPSIAGILIAAGTGSPVSKPALCFLINSISYLAVIVSLLIIRPKPVKGSSRTEPMLVQIREGIAFARRNVLIRSLLVLTGFASVFALQYPTVLPAFAKDVLKVDSRGLGAMMSAAGLGALSAAIFVAALGHLFKPKAMVILGSILAPSGILALSASHNFVLSIGCLVFTGFGMMLFLAVSNTIVQVASPDELRGRMLSLRTLVFMGLSPLGALQIGTVAQHLGVQTSMAGGGIICIAAAVYFAFFSRFVKDECAY